MATHSIVLAWRIPGMGEPGGLPSMGSHKSQTFCVQNYLLHPMTKTFFLLSHFIMPESSLPWDQFSPRFLSLHANQFPEADTALLPDVPRNI